jgi:hypothetical protein
MFIPNPWRKRPFGRNTHTWEYNIPAEVRDSGCED